MSDHWVRPCSLLLAIFCSACQTTSRASHPHFTEAPINQTPLRLSDDSTRKHPDGVFKGTYRICVGPDGTVSDVIPIKGISEVNEYLIPQIKTGWLYAKREKLECFPKHVLLEAAEQLHSEEGVEQQAGVVPIKNPYPDVAIPYFEKHPNDITKGKYEICIATNGKVSSARPIKGVEGMDESVLAHIKAKWLFEPVSSPTCITKNFVFETYSYP